MRATAQYFGQRPEDATWVAFGQFEKDLDHRCIDRGRRMVTVHPSAQVNRHARLPEVRTVLVAQVIDNLPLLSRPQNFGRIHAAVLGLPLSVRDSVHAILAADIDHLATAFRFHVNSYDLAFRDSKFPHLAPLSG